MIFKPLEISCRELWQCSFDIIFSLSRAPEVSNVGVLSLFHIVKWVENSLLFCYKPLINFKCAYWVSIMSFRLTVTKHTLILNLVDWFEIVHKLKSWHFIKLFWCLYLSLKIFLLRGNLIKRWNLKSLTHKRITDSLYSLLYQATLLKDNNIHCLISENLFPSSRSGILLEILEESQSLASCGSEQ